MGYQSDDKGLTENRDVLLLQWQDGELKHVYPTGDEYSDIANGSHPWFDELRVKKATPLGEYTLAVTASGSETASTSAAFTVQPKNGK